MIRALPGGEMRTSALVALALCLPTAAHALTADEIVARHVEARGGAAKLQALQSLRMTGKVIFGGDDFALTAEFGLVSRRPDSIRREVTLQGLTAIDAYDGKESWSVDPFNGRRDPFRTAADESRGLAQDADFEGALIHAREKGHKVEYLGTEDVDGTPAHKLRVSLKDGDIQYVYLDPDQFLEIRRVSERHVRGSERINETDFGSYVQVDGVWIPSAIESGRKGGPKNMRVTVERAEGNVPVDDALFRFPAGAAARVILPSQGAAPLGGQAPAAAGGRPPVLDDGVISGLGARNIGSATMSGRISAVAARNQGGKTTLYVGAASGGVWKSIDGGTTFKPVFDKQPVQSIGAIAIDPTNPQTIWVGTGESWTRNSVSFGDGIYKSTDGGESWKKMGLPRSERIARVIVHPKNGEVVYACVPGNLFSDSPDRGLYKTTDGGKSWDLILTGGNLSTGCSDVAMDPANPEVLFGGLWDFRRKGWTFRSGGEGPDAPSGSGLFKTTDGGANWTEVKGLSPKPWGRVAVSIAPSDSKVVYTFVESKDSALYRSGDGGNTWEQRDKSQMMVWRPFYFARLIVDPAKADHLFKPDLELIVSEDGGKSFARTGGFSAHGDWHDLWIDPDNTQHMVGGNDGGLFISFDGGNRWWKSNNLPVSQFYHVSVDDRDPYRVYGGLQDNSSWVGPSAYGGGISNATWENLYGGDGFWTVPDPTDPEAVYLEAQGGYIARVDRRLQLGRDIQPKAGYHEKLRYNWNTPIYTSPTQKGTIYLGAQFLFRSRDRGESWERISPDLTTNDPQKQKQEESGGVTVDNSSAEMHTTIYSISESPFDAKVIWAGTDDGNVQLSRDGGKSWSNQVKNVKGLPRGAWTSWVEASRHDAGTAYVTFDRHTFGDMNPYVYRTTDLGKTWSRIAGPEQGLRGYAHVVREDSVNKGLLFVGTELGLWISVDGGRAWAEFKGSDFPAVAVRDIQVHPRDNDLVLGTHGRGIWIIDDLTPLRSLSAEVLARDAAFLPGRPTQQRINGQGGWADGDAAFSGPNPSGGAVVTYYQRTRHLYGPIKLEVLDAQGNLVDTIPATKRRGINRVAWTMQVKPPRVPRAAQVAFSASQGPRVVSGSYTLRLTKGGQVIERKLEIGLDRRAPFTVADRKEHFDAAMKAHALFGQMSDLVDKLEGARASAESKLKGLPPDDELGKKIGALTQKLGEVKKKIVATKEGGAITGEERIREHADLLYGALLSWEGKPAKYLVERTEVLKRELDDVKKEFDAVVAQQIGALNPLLEQRGLTPITTAAAPAAPADARKLAGACIRAGWDACGQEGPGAAAAGTR
jgi:photosystem II stability/assembly factor-like uncharacterized protein